MFGIIYLYSVHLEQNKVARDTLRKQSLSVTTTLRVTFKPKDKLVQTIFLRT